MRKKGRRAESVGDVLGDVADEFLDFLEMGLPDEERWNYKEKSRKSPADSNSVKVCARPFSYLCLLLDTPETCSWVLDGGLASALLCGLVLASAESCAVEMFVRRAVSLTAQGRVCRVAQTRAVKAKARAKAQMSKLTARAAMRSRQRMLMAEEGGRRQMTRASQRAMQAKMLMMNWLHSRSGWGCSCTRRIFADGCAGMLLRERANFSSCAAFDLMSDDSYMQARVFAANIKACS